jgi:hypothetical protein
VPPPPPFKPLQQQDSFALARYLSVRGEPPASRPFAQGRPSAVSSAPAAAPEQKQHGATDNNNKYGRQARSECARQTLGRPVRESQWMARSPVVGVPFAPDAAGRESSRRPPRRPHRAGPFAGAKPALESSTRNDAHRHPGARHQSYSASSGVEPHRIARPLSAKVWPAEQLGAFSEKEKLQKAAEISSCSRSRTALLTSVTGGEPAGAQLNGRQTRAPLDGRN